MSRLPRLEEYRYVGTRDNMRFYDCEDSAQFEALEDRVKSLDLIMQNQVQTFAPDTAIEAMNRSFKPARI
jgi:hypothetical protein